MRGLLIIGVKESSHRTNRVIEELEKRNAPYKFVRWKTLVFKNNHLFSDQEKLTLSDFQGIFFDIPYYETTVKNPERKYVFNLINEFYILINTCKRLKIKAINRDFVINHPFYNKFTLSQSYLGKKLSAIPTYHFIDNRIENVLPRLEMLNLSFPLVVKQSHGSMGDQVWKIEDETELKTLLSERRNDNLVFQPFFKNEGDFRVLVVNGKSLGIMRRKAKEGEWRNNYSQGGKIEQYQDETMEKFVEGVAKKMGLDYVGLDLFKQDNQYYIIEINIFASFQGFEKACSDKNVAEKIVDFLLS